MLPVLGRTTTRLDEPPLETEFVTLVQWVVPRVGCCSEWAGNELARIK